MDYAQSAQQNITPVGIPMIVFNFRFGSRCVCSTFVTKPVQFNASRDMCITLYPIPQTVRHTHTHTQPTVLFLRPNSNMRARVHDKWCTRINYPRGGRALLITCTRKSNCSNCALCVLFPICGQFSSVLALGACVCEWQASDARPHIRTDGRTIDIVYHPPI